VWLGYIKYYQPYYHNNIAITVIIVERLGETIN